MFVPYALMYINKCVPGIYNYCGYWSSELLTWPVSGEIWVQTCWYTLWATRPNPVNPTPGVKQLVGDADRFYTKYIGLYVVFIWHSGRLWSVVIHVHVAKNFGCWEGGGGGVFKLTSGIGICIDMQHKMEATLKIST